MIPKVIHYCWFGGNPLPESAKKCIASWRKFMPDYEIKEWNESNFDVNIIPYTAEAYKAKKYAFVSDYARFWILYHHGGLYFDTDVEVIANMDDIIARGSFMGKEVDTSEGKQAVAPGLCMGAEAGMEIYRRMLEWYDRINFLMPDGKINTVSMIPMITEMLEKDGLKGGGGIQTIDGITIYPPDYFNPWDDALGKLNKTANTRSIHWYSKTWLPKESIAAKWAKRIIRRIFGKEIKQRLFGK